MKKYIECAAAIEAAYQGLKRPSNTEEWKRICEQLQNVPAADVVEVRHGRWIGYPECLKYTNAYSDDHIVCSACEECFSILDNDCERFNFCPRCGAKMDGGVNDERIY